MSGPGDKFKAFMQRFIGPKSQKPFRQVQHSISNSGDVTGVRKRKLKKGLTGDPYEDERRLYGSSDPSIFERPLTLEDQRPRMKGEPAQFIGKIVEKRKAKKQKKEETKKRHEEIYAQQQKAIEEGNFSSTQTPTEGSKKTKKKKTRHIPTKF